MSIRAILSSRRGSRQHPGPRARRHTVSPGWLFALSALVLAPACAPRQAIVESEPNPGAGGSPTAPSPSVGSAALRGDLERFATAQAAFEADHGYYASRPGDLDFAASSGVRVSIIQGDRQGWSAVATSGGDECGMFHGDIRSPRGYMTRADQVACR